MPGTSQLLAQFNFDNEPMRQVLLHFTDQETWLETKLPARDQELVCGFLFNLILVPKPTI